MRTIVLNRGYRHTVLRTLFVASLLVSLGAGAARGGYELTWSTSNGVSGTSSGGTYALTGTLSKFSGGYGTDTDGDGMLDNWETQYGLDPNDPNDATLDLDSDTYSNLCEFLHNSDPNDALNEPSTNATIDVPQDVNGVQDAINATIDGDVIILAQGTYYETLDFNGRPVWLRSTDPNDPNVVAATIIDANNTSLDVVTFNSGEDANSILDGITITGGRYGIYCTTSSSPTVSHCVMRDNASRGLYAYTSSSPTMRDCEITGNSSAGVYLYGGSAMVSNCRILSNGPYGVYLRSHSGTVSNCVIAKNANYGVYLSSSGSSRIVNCTIADHASRGINGSCTEITNCILWSNNYDLTTGSATYSCIEDQDAGTGNIHALPMFVDPDANDYHLWYSSPCIDAGDPCSVYANEPNGGGGRINMGAYGNTAEARVFVDADSDGLDDAWELTYWPGDDPNLHDPEDDPDGDGLRNKDEYYASWDPNSDDSASIDGLVHNSRVDVNYPSISLALSTALNNDVLILDPNTYYETVNFNNKPAWLRGTDPNDPNAVAATIIDANNASLDVVTFTSGEDANSILDGITLTDGKYGIYCNNSSPTVNHCIIRDNANNGLYAYNQSSPAVSDCEITGNNAYGVYLYGGSTLLSNCRVLNNSYAGVYTRSHSGTLSNCVIAKNASYGVSLYSGTSTHVVNCTIADNANHGIHGSCPEITNCILWGNTNGDLGGGSATYSCIEDEDAGTGNIHIWPFFVDADANDYHLWYSSPCIDAGDPCSVYANEPNGGGGRINMGAYGNTTEARTSVDADSDGLDDAWELTYWPGDDPNLHDPNDDPDGDGLRNRDEYNIAWSPTSDNSSSIVGIVLNGTTDHRYPSISMAITRALDGATLILNPQTYYETVDFSGKAVWLRSTDPNDPNVVAATVIDANNTSLDVVVFNSGEDANSILDGITITGGKNGAYCISASSPTISHCVLQDNAYYGLSTNDSSPTVSDCTIAKNTNEGVYTSGGAVALDGCRIVDNGLSGVVCTYSSLATLENCVVVMNGSNGIGSHNDSSPTVTNCTVAHNANRGIYGACSEITNCIVWGHTDDLYNCSATYSCIEDQDTGTGNIHADPLFVDADANDYHLWYSSWCIDAGDPCSVYANEPNGGGGRINMGAYGNTAEARVFVDADSDGLDDAWELTYWPGDDPNLHDPGDDPDADGLRNKDEYYVYWDPNSDDSASITHLVYNSRVDANYPSIALALVMALNDDSLILGSHTYYELVDFNGKPVWLRSTDPNDPNVVAATIIDANDTAAKVVNCGSGEGAGSILDGVTVTGGQFGVYCSSASSPTISHCLIRDNAYYGVSTNGSSPTLRDCTIADNTQQGAYMNGGAPTLRDCRIVDNDSTGVACVYSSTATLENCVIARNASHGIGSYSDATPTVTNCTIAHNTTGGIYGACGAITNCIIWGHTDDLYNCSATYSCIEDADAGTGNIHADPLFVDTDANDFHLDVNSPCIDGGVPWHDYAQEPSPNGGRINMGAYGNTTEAATTTDADSDGIADAWETLYWPSDDPNLHDPGDDPDSDTLTNWSEYLFGSDPTTTDPNAVLTILYGSLSTTQFDPTNAETVTAEYWINIDANAVTSVVDANDPNETVRTLTQAATVGRNQVTWDGKDPNSLIVEWGDYDLAVDANDGVATDHYDFGTVLLTYDHRVSNVTASPYRFIAIYNEITTITYDLDVDADMVVSLYDPNGILFRTIDVPQADPEEIVWGGRSADPNQPDSRYISTGGEYNIEVRYQGMREKAEGQVNVYR